MMLDVALLQLNAGPEIAPNLDAAEALARQAAKQGARFVLTPENTCHMRARPADKLQTSPWEAEHPALPRFQNLSKELGIWFLLGSIAVKVSDNKIANRSYLISPKGDIVANYDKIHLFDVTLPNGDVYHESQTVQAGGQAVAASTDFGRVGMTICYDLRFAALFRKLALAGSGILTVPSAFTVPTGRAHWEVLLRARAIETGSFVLAPAQTGAHEGGRETYGHSMIVAPWGDIVAQGGAETGIVAATVDLRQIDTARQSIPALQHDRHILGPFTDGND